MIKKSTTKVFFTFLSEFIFNLLNSMPIHDWILALAQSAQSNRSKSFKEMCLLNKQIVPKHLVVISIDRALFPDCL